MPFKPKSGQYYRMPVFFGPTPGPRQWPEGRDFDFRYTPRMKMIGVRMLTNADQLAAHGIRAGLWFTPFSWDPRDPLFKGHQEWFVKKQDGSLYEVLWAGWCLDMTRPQARAFLGLPDVTALHAIYLDQMQKLMKDGVTAADVEKLMANWLPSGAVGFEQFQKAMWGAMSTMTGSKP